MRMRVSAGGIGRHVLLTLLWPAFGAIYLFVLSNERPLGTPTDEFFLALIWIEAGLLTPWIVQRASRYPLTGAARSGSLSHHLRFGVILVAVIVIGNNLTMWLITGRLVSQNLPPVVAIALKIPVAIVYSVVIYIVTLLLPSVALMAREWADDQARTAQLQLERAQVELDRFRLGLQPSLVSGTLRSVASIIDEDSARAEKLVHELAGFVRLTLDTADRPSISLHEEADLLRMYLSLVANRAGFTLGNLSIRGDDVRIPPGVLQATLSACPSLRVSGDITGDLQSSLSGNGVVIVLVINAMHCSEASSRSMAGVEASLQPLPGGCEVRITVIASPGLDK